MTEFRRAMESQELPSSPSPHGDASRPSLGFPLGTALLLIVIFSLSGIVSCCYHWDKLRSLRRRSLSPDAAAAAAVEDPSSPAKSVPSPLNIVKQRQSLPVVMPGDNVPKFIALPCPCEPPRLEKIVVEVQKQLKPPGIPVPSYI